MSDIEKIYINEGEAAIRYGYSKSWFQRSRWQGDGPKFLKCPGKILYHIAETDLWFESQGRCQSTKEYKSWQKNKGKVKESTSEYGDWRGRTAAARKSKTLPKN